MEENKPRLSLSEIFSEAAKNLGANGFVANGEPGDDGESITSTSISDQSEVTKKPDEAAGTSAKPVASDVSKPENPVIPSDPTQVNRE